MDSIHFDGYTTYSDSSAPRTPSPRNPSPTNYKPAPDFEPLMSDLHPSADSHPYWQNNHSSLPLSSAQQTFSYNPPVSRTGSLLQELYDSSDLGEHHPPPHTDAYLEHSAEPSFGGGDSWPQLPQQHQQQHHQHHQQQRPTDYTTFRRATFPYVRHDREEQVPYQQYPYMQQQQPPLQHESAVHPYPSRQEQIYGESLQLSAEQTGLQDNHFIPSLNSSPHSSYHEFDDSNPVKLEDPAPIMVPSQTSFYRPAVPPSHHSMVSYLSPHTGLPVQHTDDAASKETQYLRRRCFNCHTTEPPSWRRSTLNPGKIVCNKCGLYERTHLRPRPLRFDELRAGNKARKQSTKGAVSPKQKLGIVKKEPREFGLARRSSVSSSSSVHSSSGASDWDDNVSIYSSGSAPPTSYNSPSIAPFPLNRDSQSPPRDGGIRLPNAPLSDIASLQGSPLPTSPPRKLSTPYYTAQGNGAQDYFRRGSISDAHSSPLVTAQEISVPSPGLSNIGAKGGWQSDISKGGANGLMQGSVATAAVAS